MILDSIISYQVVGVAPTKGGTEGLGLSIQDLTAYLYAYNGLIASTQTERLQRVFDVFASLFDRVGLQTNEWKTVSMSCQLCYTPGQMLLEVHERSPQVSS